MEDNNATTENISEFYTKYYDSSTSTDSEQIDEPSNTTTVANNIEMEDTVMENRASENIVTENKTADSEPIENLTSENCESCESKYHTLNAIREKRDSIKKRLDEYNEKYLKKTVESGREFIKDLNAEPLKKIDELIDNSTKAAKTLKADSIKKYDELKDKTKEIREKTKEFTQKIKSSPFKAAGDMVKEAKEDISKKVDKYTADYKETKNKIVENIEKDAETIRHDIIDAGKKAIDKIGFKKTIEEKLNSTIERFPSMLNLPSKKEVEELIKGIDSVNRKVDHLADQFAG